MGPDAGRSLGHSREGRVVRGFRLGSGPLRVSLVGGCHADEPVGPRFLARLTGYLQSRPPDDPILTDYEWWIVPHVNPDGAQRNAAWQDGEGPVGPSEAYDPVRYLSSVVRELPGDDLEFGFPRSGDDVGARPESRAVWEWWQGADGPFHMHATLHGIAMAGGPWFLLEPEWLGRVQHVMTSCARETHRLGYELHDVDREGEKGFHRIERGFCTRPNSAAMRQHFLDLGDEETAARFRPNSMEAVRSLGGDPLTLVSEMPLFITPGVGENVGPPDPAADAWKERRTRWQRALARDEDPARVEAEIRASGLVPMPVLDQMRLQWRLVSAGAEQIRLDRAKTAS